MNIKYFIIAFFVVVFAGMIYYPNSAAAGLKDKWQCTIDLHQGDTGTIEFAKDGSHIIGKIIITKKTRTSESTIEGEFGETEVYFKRTLSDMSYQPFKGIISIVDTKHMKIEGLFASGFSGKWSADCTMADSTEPTRVNLNSKSEKEKEVKPVIIKKEPTLPKGTPPKIIYDFIAKASQAKWTNASTELDFPGDPPEKNGFARTLENAKLEDGKSYNKVLQTNPQLKPHGIITGRYANITIPASGAEFRAKIGFLEDAIDSEGVFYEVRGEFPGYSGILLRREYFKPYNKSLITDFSIDLSSFKGLKGTIILSVAAGKKPSDQDSAVWLEPQLVSLANEYKFASFVGGAVGTGRNENQLMNPWGGKSGYLYGDVMLFLLFANIDKEYDVRIDSYREDKFVGSTDFRKIKKDQTEIWQTLQRKQPGEWKEHVVFNGTYVAEIRYTISESGE